MGQNLSWGWFAQVLLQHALNTRDGYRPGDSFDVNVGFHYDGLVRSSSLVPMLQVIGSFRGRDGGSKSDPENTGYQRLLVAPGVEFQINPKVQLFADIRIPIITNVTGYQLVAPSLLNATASISL